ncbi:hypothetical protein B0H13DRAFT_2313429 [Mycena leptocephala]|nr:hypothetical protein B0H13DRAFT_2313429 [Mycena leptocephala]
MARARRAVVAAGSAQQAPATRLCNQIEVSSNASNARAGSQPPVPFDESRFWPNPSPSVRRVTAVSNG